MSNKERLENLFTYHPPMGTQLKRYENIRKEFLYLAQFVDENCPDSNEKETAFKLLHMASMMCNASIAVNE